MSAVRPVAIVLPLLAGLLASCVSVAWRRDRRFAPPPAGAIESLEAGGSTLAECLDRLGAPLYVWEYKADGAALAWGWSDRKEWGLSVSVPLYEQASASFSYDEIESDLRGAVLFFGRDLVLERVREGRLRDLEQETGRRRPSLQGL